MVNLAQNKENKCKYSEPRWKRLMEREGICPLANPDVCEQDKGDLEAFEERLGRPHGSIIACYSMKWRRGRPRVPWVSVPAPVVRRTFSEDASSQSRTTFAEVSTIPSSMSRIIA